MFCDFSSRCTLQCNKFIVLCLSTSKLVVQEWYFACHMILHDAAFQYVQAHVSILFLVSRHDRVACGLGCWL